MLQASQALQLHQPLSASVSIVCETCGYRSSSFDRASTILAIFFAFLPPFNTFALTLDNDLTVTPDPPSTGTTEILIFFAPRPKAHTNLGCNCSCCGRCTINFYFRQLFHSCLQGIKRVVRRIRYLKLKLLIRKTHNLASASYKIKAIGNGSTFPAVLSSSHDLAMQPDAPAPLPYLPKIAANNPLRLGFSSR